MFDRQMAKAQAEMLKHGLPDANDGWSEREDLAGRQRSPSVRASDAPR